MELILLAACAWLAYQGGAQSEQAKLGVSPAQRDIMREEARHEKAVRRIGEKHGPAVASSATRTGTASGPADGVPETFLSGYRSSRPDHPTLSHRAGQWAARGVSWGQGAGRDAWHKYRKRREDAGHDDPGPVLVPIPPAQPPKVPPMPADPPTAGSEKGKDGTTREPVDKAPPAIPAEVPPKPSEAPKEAPKAPDEETADSAKKPSEPAADEDPDFDLDEPLGPSPEPEQHPKAPDHATPPGAETETLRPDTTPQPADTPQGVGRMASEVTYDSVMDESDELSIMCDDDARICERIHDRAEREIGRGDALGAEMQASGWGSKILGWLARCKESYGVIRSEVLALQHNTIAQGEAVAMGKSYLEAGQGVYADIAKDMESVLDRQAYISDAVDAEDTSAHTEIYETKAAS